MPEALKRHLRRLVTYVRTLVADARGVGNRAALSVVVPLLAVLMLGHIEWAGYAAFVAFASLYGRNRLHINRFEMQLSVGACLLAAVLLGVLVSLSPISHVLAIPVAMAIALFGALMSEAQDWHPKGPLFLIFAYGSMAAARHESGDLIDALVVGGLTLAWVLFIGSVWMLRQDEPVSHLWQHRMRVGFTLRLNWQPVENAFAVGIAGAIAAASGVGRPIWAMVAAVVPLAAQSTRTQVKRGIHRIVGTLGGLVLAYAILPIPLPAAGQILVVGILQLLAELFVARNYAVALLFVTPLSLLMVQLSEPAPVGTVIFQRGFETVIGSLVGLAIVFVSHALSDRLPQRPIT